MRPTIKILLGAALVLAIVAGLLWSRRTASTPLQAENVPVSAPSIESASSTASPSLAPKMENAPVAVAGNLAADSTVAAQISTPANPLAATRANGAASDPSQMATPETEAHAAEVAATVRMIAAHAPLRVREVADPDSASNKEILNTMVQKALARSKAVAPATSPAN